jgi:RNA polymerase sigma-70 factor (ECF subfamily)
MLSGRVTGFQKHLHKCNACCYLVVSFNTLEPVDYKKLVKDCLKNLPQAQWQLYNHFAPPMMGVCYRYTKSVSDAEDVLQEGFIKVFQYLPQYRFEGELAAWIRRIIVNTALTYLKRNTRYGNELAFDEISLHPVSQENPHVMLQAKEVADLIRQLPTGYQTIFNLHAIEGYTHVEIGKMLGIDKGTSRSQYSRARNLLISWIKNKETIKEQRYAAE